MYEYLVQYLLPFSVLEIMMTHSLLGTTGVYDLQTVLIRKHDLECTVVATTTTSVRSSDQIPK